MRLANPFKCEMPPTTRDDYLGLLRFSAVVCPVFVITSLVVIRQTPTEERRSAVLAYAVLALGLTVGFLLMAWRRYRRQGGAWTFRHAEHVRIARLGWMIPVGAGLGLLAAVFLRPFLERSIFGLAVVAALLTSGSLSLLIVAVHEVRRRAWGD